jgi:hypothetical protein
MSPEDYTNVDLKALGIDPVPEMRDPETGFVVGGKNPTSLIAKLGKSYDRTIDQLEKDMRPGGLSTAGFLGVDEKLLDVLAKDNRSVVEELGLTHQELARHLRVLGALGSRAKGGETEFVYHGRRFKVKVIGSRGFQESPFRDGTRTNSEATVTNLDNGKRLHFSLLVPEMIERYGFYEGQGTRYRVDPHAVVDVLDFLKRKAK